MSIQHVTPEPSTEAIKAQVQEVYEAIAAEYDERIPGSGHADDLFTAAELDFIMNKVEPTESILDMGCGTGRFTVPLAATGADVTGLDLTQAMLDRTALKLQDAHLTAVLQQGDMAQLPFPDESFDVVVSMLALMHIPLADRQAVFLEAARVLKPGGRVLLSVKNSIFERMFKGDRFAAVDQTDVDHGELIFTHTRSGTEFRAPWHSFAPHDVARLFATAGMTMTHLRGNSPISVWLAEEVLEQQGIRAAVSGIEAVLSDVAPLNQLGYHLLVEGVKPR
jgi:ubiquinone/menaquinone biosynthesis C-methylase UbiE